MLNTSETGRAQAPDRPQVDARNDPRAGLRFILDRLGPTTLVAIHPDGTDRITGQWLDDASMEAAVEWAERKNRAGFNLYFTPNLPRVSLAKKPRKADIEAIRCLYADVDAKDGRTLDQALDAVVSLPLQPTLIIASGGGYQPIWALDQAVPATPEATAWAEAAGAALAGMIVGDAVQNIDRVLRLPFTMNYPDAKKRTAGRVPCLAGVVLAGDIG